LGIGESPSGDALFSHPIKKGHLRNWGKLIKGKRERPGARTSKESRPTSRPVKGSEEVCPDGDGHRDVPKSQWAEKRDIQRANQD